ncbi:hypothetical protein C453_04399 [Haloferax elongans ATCC BAA-1513]|uniref:Integral membrane protein n=1 Tax=Haloferax elongans ATCC BAA-1513 TaxID=1230453 RepID=M0HWS2_HALEO|nr:hypothetical protein [Haloferax elongans]ELZ87564.1 hypothetical protein C453_04399 [Haloferax elongans ATCC BAA-1513]
MATTTSDGGEVTRLHYIGVALAAVTGLIHLALGAGALASNLADPLGLAFIAAAAGFAGGIVAVLRGDEQLRSRAILLGIPFVAGQVVFYVVLNWPDIFGIGGVVDKIIQLALIGVLVTLYRRES